MNKADAGGRYVTHPGRADIEKYGNGSQFFRAELAKADP
jgi:hypothetical protein